ncbi:hypothetical protein [Ciceribacter azotifigens]|uniref:hypothetical protein n=1 Tax=Ciceribacter azotifigens TaxID=2069303 RepID=UPI003A895710
MTTRKITIPAFLEVRTEGNETAFVSFEKIAASAELQARLLPRDRRRFMIAQARLRGGFKTAEDVVLTLDQWWAMMRAARRFGLDMPRVRVET